MDWEALQAMILSVYVSVDRRERTSSEPFKLNVLWQIWAVRLYPLFARSFPCSTGACWPHAPSAPGRW